MTTGWALVVEQEVPKIMRSGGRGGLFMVFFYESLAKDYLAANPHPAHSIRRVEIEIKEVVE